MKNHFTTLSALAILAVVPAVVHARTISDLIQSLFNFVNNLLIPLIIALALFLFFFWITVFIYKREEGFVKAGGPARSFLLWGIIALFVMTSVWGILSVITNSFGIPLAVPQFRENRGTE